MNAFAERLRELRRYYILRLLAEAPGNEVAAEVLYLGLPRGIGGSVAMIAGDLAWLSDAGLIDLAEIGGVKLARITRHGDDVAAGRGNVAGVRRPLPGD